MFEMFCQYCREDQEMFLTNSKMVRMTLWAEFDLYPHKPDYFDVTLVGEDNKANKANKVVLTSSSAAACQLNTLIPS